MDEHWEFHPCPSWQPKKTSLLHAGSTAAWGMNISWFSFSKISQNLTTIRQGDMSASFKNIVTSLVSSELTRNFIAPQKILLSRVAIDCAWFLQDLRLLLECGATILLLYYHPTVTTQIHPGKQLKIDWNRFDEIADWERYLNRNLNNCQKTC